MENGLWNCKRCGAEGKLTDFWQERPQLPPGQAARARRADRLRRAFEAPEPGPEREPGQAPPGPDAGAAGSAATGAGQWRRHLEALARLDDTPGAAYCLRRGIPLEVATGAGVSFAPRFFGRPAVVFPLHSQGGSQGQPHQGGSHGGALVAIQGRYIDGRADPKARTVGPKSQGIFTAPARVGAWFFEATDQRLPALILTEAPLDALSLAACGFPAIALCGTSGPAWLHLVCGLRRVLLATDADEAGDRAAQELAARLEPFGARCERLRPEGGKDWNEALQRAGRVAIDEFITPRLAGH